jgi:hypothetical protein
MAIIADISPFAMFGTIDERKKQVEYADEEKIISNYNEQSETQATIADGVK